MTRTLPRGVDPDVDPDRFPFIDLDDADLAGSLRQWERVMSTPWFGTPGTAGADALETILKAVKTWHVVWRSNDGSFAGASEAAYRAATFDRRADDTSPYMHGYDVTRMYPTAAGITDVTPGALRPGPRQFDKSLAGWWLVDVAPWCWTELPDPAGYPSRSWTPGQPRFLTTPTVKLLQDLHDCGAHGGFTVLGSYVGTGRPLFREWNARLERLYAEAGTPEMKTAVKAAGRETLGLLNSPTYSTHRPDWHHAVIAQARANLFRKIWKAYGIDQRTPLMVDTDCVWYGSNDPDPVYACPAAFTIGDKPGQLKHKGTVTR